MSSSPEDSSPYEQGEIAPSPDNAEEEEEEEEVEEEEDDVRVVDKKSVERYVECYTVYMYQEFFTSRVLTRVLKWWVPGLTTFENGESHHILVSPSPKMMSPDFSYNRPLSESLIFHKS